MGYDFIVKPGQASKTAELVCTGRAIAHAAGTVPRFSDPTALVLLSDEGRARVAQFRHGVRPSGLRARMRWEYLDKQSKAMVARTVAIDDAVREAAASQVVILGAGLDGRAWRMSELRDAIVFEIDHPDSQRVKRERIATLTRAAHEVRFVAVDFTRDSLDAALAAAGHDASRPTMWIWEGVVMYLTPAQVAATLAIVAARSAKGSRLVVVYHRPALMLHIVGLFLRRLGEPLRSQFTPEAMSALLAAHGFTVLRDDDVSALGAAISPDLAKPTMAMRHLRIAVAERR